LGGWPLEDGAMDGRNAQITVIAKRCGERVKSTLFCLSTGYSVRKECAYERTFPSETGRLRLAFGLRWRPQEGRDERDPQTSRDLGV
jgi:hypothetical protein